jgi:hypothetical protein
MKRARLLTDPTQPTHFAITLTLQEGKTAEFIYNDRNLARQHWDQLQGQGVVAGLAIRQYDYKEYTRNEKDTTSERL